MCIAEVRSAKSEGGIFENTDEVTGNDWRLQPADGHVLASLRTHLWDHQKRGGGKNLDIVPRRKICGETGPHGCGAQGSWLPAASRWRARHHSSDNGHRSSSRPSLSCCCGRSPARRRWRWPHRPSAGACFAVAHPGHEQKARTSSARPRLAATWLNSMPQPRPRGRQQAATSAALDGVVWPQQQPPVHL